MFVSSVESQKDVITIQCSIENQKGANGALLVLNGTALTPLVLSQIYADVYIYPSISNATRLWSIIFLLSWIFIHQVRYLWKACLFAFRLMPYLLGLFHWGACRVSKLGAMSKRKSCKIDRIVWEMHAMSSFGLSFCECMHMHLPTAHSLCRNPPKLPFWHCPQFTHPARAPVKQS